jgi:hypothetical protein
VTWENLLLDVGEERGYKVLYNLGLAYEAAGNPTRAIERYRSFAARVAERADSSPLLSARAMNARERAAQLEASNGAVEVHGPRSGVVLTRVDAGEPRPAGYVVWLAPGPHKIELFVGSAHPRMVDVEVKPGARVDIETASTDEASVPVAEGHSLPPAPEKAPAQASALPTWTLITGVTAAASLVAPAGLYFLATSKRNEAERLGPGNTEYAAARSSYNTWRSIYIASYGLPVLLAGTSVTLAVLNASSKGGAKVALGARSVVVDGSF